MIEIFNLTRSHQTSRTSQISQISIFHLKEKFEKSSTKQMDVEDIYDGVFTNEKERKLSTAKTVA